MLCECGKKMERTGLEINGKSRKDKFKCSCGKDGHLTVLSETSWKLLLPKKDFYINGKKARVIRHKGQKING